MSAPTARDIERAQRIRIPGCACDTAASSYVCQGHREFARELADERERCCHAACDMCREEDYALEHDPDIGWRHRVGGLRFKCHADAIRSQGMNLLTALAALLLTAVCCVGVLMIGG